MKHTYRINGISCSGCVARVKKTLMELGPTGFPFEKFVGKALEHEGFRTQAGVVVQGNCVQHEVDVIAEKANKQMLPLYN